jgi:hypothetical protein
VRAKEFCKVLILSRKDFLYEIKKEEEDWEKFNMIKDELIYGG